jgi:hypothetical protein
MLYTQRNPGQSFATVPGLCRWAALALVLVLLATGCVETKSFLNLGGEPTPKGTVHQVVVTWQNDINYSPDPTRGGSLTPVMAGRLYLFGPDIGFPLEGDGKVVVEMYNESPGAGLAPLERWQLDQTTLKRLLRKDMIGWGYTLVLPWGSYRPDITQVRMKVGYEPAKGWAVFSENPVTVKGVQSYEAASRQAPAAAPQQAQQQPAQTTPPTAGVQPAAAQAAPPKPTTWTVPPGTIPSVVQPTSAPQPALAPLPPGGLQRLPAQHP